MSCACGRAIEDDFSFCPSCGADVGGRSSSRSASFCRTFRECAEWTFARLVLGWRSGIPLREDTVSEVNLQGIYLSHRDRVSVRRFSPREESHAGADWEWWFHVGGRGFGLRVQAKRASRDNSYPLRHKVGGRLQNDLLIEDAVTAGCLPMYVLYNHDERLPQMPSAGCAHSLDTPQLRGCSIVSGLTVRKALADEARPHVYTRKHSIPWNEIVCGADTDGSLLELVHDRVRELHWKGLGQVADLPEDRLQRGEHAEGLDRSLSKFVTGATLDSNRYPDFLEDRRLRELARIAARPTRSRLPGRVLEMIDRPEVEAPDERITHTVIVDLAPGRG